MLHYSMQSKPAKSLRQSQVLIYCRPQLLIKSVICPYDETTVVRPKYWNQRIANQAGVFMVFPNHLIDRYKYILIHESELGLDMAIERAVQACI